MYLPGILWCCSRQLAQTCTARQLLIYFHFKGSASGTGSGSRLGSRPARLRADAVEVVHAAARRFAGRPRGLPCYEQVSPGFGALALARRPGSRRPRARGERRRRRPGRDGRAGAARAVCRQPARGRQVGGGRQRGGARRRRPSLLMEVRRRARVAVGPCVGRAWRCSSTTSACGSDMRCCGRATATLDVVCALPARVAY